MKKKLLVTILLGIVIASLGFYGAATSTVNAESGELGWVVMANGDVSISSISGMPHYGDPVSPGDRIVTGGGCSLIGVRMAIEGGGTRLVTVGPNSDITLSVESTPSSLGLQYFKGKLRDIARNCEGPIEILTPYAVIAHRGTEYLLETGPAPTGWVENPANGHYYKLTDGLDWLGAEAQAVAWGGHLVTINNAAEESWLMSTFCPGHGGPFYIGLNDIAVEGLYEWASGEPVTYTNWGTDEPGNSPGEEDAVHMYCSAANGWNDVPMTLGANGIAEVLGVPDLEVTTTALEHTVEVSVGTESVTLLESCAVLATSAGLAEPYPIDSSQIDRWWEGIAIIVASPVDLYVTDPLGRHVGTAPGGGTVNEIPDAIYSGPDAVHEEVFIPNPPRGNYDIALLAVGNGNYTLQMQALGVSDEPLVESYNGTVETGQTKTYAVLAEYPPDLTISSTQGGSVTTPGEGTFTYHEGTMINLVAEPEEGYNFVNWAGDVGTIGDDEDATTTIAMDDDYEITANFGEVGGGEVSCGMASAIDVAPIALVSVGLVAVWVKKRRGRGSEHI